MSPTPVNPSDYPRQAPTISQPDPAPLFAPRLAMETEPCSTCGALLAADQRYCLSCGERRAGTRVPFPAPAPPVAVIAPPPLRRRPSLPASALSALYGLAGAGALALGLLAGAVIVRANDAPVPVAAATPAPTVSPQPTAAAPAETTPVPTVAATFTADWPAGQTGWTVQLQSLPKDGTTPEAIATAKADATGKGAADVGALDSDAFASLDGGNYVIYSGVATTKQAAEDAFSALQPNFPDASVVEISDKAPQDAVKKSKEDLKQQEKTQTPEDAQKNTRKAPPTVESEGTPPPSDDKAPGAGTDATEIG